MIMAENEAKKDTASESPQGQFALQKVYTKDISFETPNSPAIFQEEWKPVVDMDISSNATPLDNDQFDVVLTITTTVKIGEKTVYLAEVHQAGIFLIKNIPDEMVGRMLATTCANILFPFAREVVADLVTRGGFPQFLLQPVNFEALYMQSQQQQMMNKEDPASETTH